LEGVGEVVLVAEVEIFGGEHLLEAVEVDLVLGGLLVGQAEKLDFLYLEDFTVVDLPDHWRFGDYYQVVVDLHLDHPIHRFYGHFLQIIIMSNTLIKLFDVTLGIFLQGSLEQPTL
jgi:hypothetical protein